MTDVYAVKGSTIFLYESWYKNSGKIHDMIASFIEKRIRRNIGYTTLSEKSGGLGLCLFIMKAPSFSWTGQALYSVSDASRAAT
jgi:glyoxylate carboligase